MRVHVPLKPHKCDFCGKSFKRPQDLKKHVKTHADDSVLMRSPEANMGQHQGGNNGFQQQDGKRESSLHSGLSPLLNRTVAGAYFGNNVHDMSAGPYPSHHQNGGQNNNGNFYPNPQQYSGYGQVNYPQNSIADQHSMDTRKRAIDALNEFLGDVKRRALDPSNYYDVGQRLGGHTQSLPLPVSIGSGYSLGGSGYNNGGYNTNNMMDSYGGSTNMSLGGGGGGAATHGPLAQSYSLPMSNARTKNDLLDIDRFLEQLQATVYETSNNAAAAGVQQPGIHSHMPGGYPGFHNQHRTSNSPPNMQHHGSTTMGSGVTPLSTVAQMANMTASASGFDTPALTPASVSSYASSGHSPMSSHSRSSVGDSNGHGLYPNLPSVTAMSDMNAGYTSAPPSGLASNFEGFEGRRYSGGRLQREAPGPHREGESDSMDLDDSARTPLKDEQGTPRPSSSSLDPALRSSSVIHSPESTTPGHSDGIDDRAQESWIENIRVIETLRKWVSERLENKDYERNEDSTPEPMDHHQVNNVDPAIDMKQDEEQISYPALKSEA